MRRALPQIIELTGFAAFTSGLYLLAGLAWTLIVAGVLVAVAAAYIERSVGA